MNARHVAFLRGINVGRAKRIAMADLRARVEDLGFRDVRTVLNSGNVVYTSPRLQPAAAAARIEKGIASTLGVSSRVTVLDGDELAAAVANNPLLKIADNHSRLFMFVLSELNMRATLGTIAKQTWGKDRIAIGAGRVVYVWCPGGFLASPLRAALDRALGDAVTTRNWATILKLDALVRSL